MVKPLTATEKKDAEIIERAFLRLLKKGIYPVVIGDSLVLYRDAEGRPISNNRVGEIPCQIDLAVFETKTEQDWMDFKIRQKAVDCKT